MVSKSARNVHYLAEEHLRLWGFGALRLWGFEALGLWGFDDENATFVPIFRNATPATTDIEASSTPNVWLIGAEKALYKTPKKTHPKSTLKNVARKLQYPTKIS